MFPAHSRDPCLQVTFVTTEVVVVIEVVERSISVVEVSVSSMDPMYDRAGLISGKLSAWTVKRLRKKQGVSWRLYVEVTATFHDLRGSSMRQRTYRLARRCSRT